MHERWLSDILEALFINFFWRWPRGETRLFKSFLEIVEGALSSKDSLFRLLMLLDLLLSLGCHVFLKRDLTEEWNSGACAKTKLHVGSLLWDQLVLFPSRFLLSLNKPPSCHPLWSFSINEIVIDLIFLAAKDLLDSKALLLLPDEALFFLWNKANCVESPVFAGNFPFWKTRLPYALFFVLRCASEARRLGGTHVVRIINTQGVWSLHFWRIS